MAIQPKHRVSAKKKQKEDWYNNAYDYFIGLGEGSNNKGEMQTFLDAANGIVNKTTFNYILSPLVAEQDQDNALPSQLRDVDIIAPIRERHLSEYLKSPYIAQVTVNNSDVILQRNSDIRTKLSGMYEDYVVSLMNEGGMDTGIEVEVSSDIDKTMEEFTEEALDERAIQGQHILKVISDSNDFDMQRIALFFDWWATEEFYTYRYIENGEFYRERIPAIEAYPIDNGEEFVEDMEGFIRKQFITYEEARAKYRTKLSNADKEILDLFSNTVPVTGELIVDRNLVSAVSSRYDGVASTTGNENVSFTKNGMVTEYTIIFKTDVKSNIVKYDNGKGDILEKRVDNDYVIDEEAGEIEMYNDWIEETWIGYQLGSSAVNVKVPPQPVLIQRYDTRFRCKLPIGGKKGLINGIYINPIPYRLLSYLALFKIYTYKQVKLVAKYKSSIVAIPKSMLASKKLSAKQQYFYMKEDGTLIYDDAKISPQNVSYGFRVVQDTGLETMLLTLNDLRRQIKEEAWELANMNKERMGDINPRAGKANTEQAIYRSKMASNLMTYIFNKALEKDHISDLQWSKVAYIDGKTGYYRSETDEPVFFNINGETHLETDYGLFVKNNEVEEQKLNDYKELAFAASQNGEFELASAAISSINSIEIKRAIEKYTEASREFQQQMEQQKTEALKAAQAQAQANTIEEIEVKENLISEREIALALINQKDEKTEEMALKQAKQLLDERKQDNAEDQEKESNRIKEEDIRSKERIAIVNKN